MQDGNLLRENQLDFSVKSFVCVCVGCRHPIQTAKVKNGLLLIIQSIKSEITLSLLTVGVVCRGLIHWYLDSQFTPRENSLDGQITNLLG